MQKKEKGNLRNRLTDCYVDTDRAEDWWLTLSRNSWLKVSCL